MSKTVFADIEGFTPLIDTLTTQYGPIRAAVFGRMWRFCQMKDGICRASLEKISDGLGIDRSTVARHIEALCDDGYLEDTTPELRNRPHIYADTGKAGIKVRIDATVAQNNSDIKTVAQRNSSVAESDTTVAQSNTTVAESRMKKVIKTEEETEEESDDLSESEPEPVDPSVTPDRQQIFDMAMSELRTQINAYHWRDYFEPLRLQSVNGTWDILTPKENLAWLRNKYVDGSLIRVMSSIAGQPVAVRFVIGSGGGK